MDGGSEMQASMSQAPSTVTNKPDWFLESQHRVAERVSRLRAYTAQNGPWSTVQTRRLLNPEELVQAVHDAVFLKDYLPTNTIDEEEEDLLLALSTVSAQNGETIDVAAAVQQWDLPTLVQSFLVAAAELLYNPYRIYAAPSSTVRLARRRQRVEAPGVKSGNTRMNAIDKFLKEAAPADGTAVVALAIRLYGLEKVIELTPKEHMSRVHAALLNKAPTSCLDRPIVVNFGGFNLETSLAFTALGARAPHDTATTSIELCNALWIDRRTCSPNDERFKVLTQQFFAFVASIQRLEHLCLNDVNLYETARHIHHIRRLTSEEEKELEKEDCKLIIPPGTITLPSTAFSSLRTLQIKFSSWSRNRGWGLYLPIMRWLTPLKSLRALHLPNPGNVHGFHAINLGFIFSELKGLTELAFQLPPRRQKHLPSIDMIMTRVEEGGREIISDSDEDRDSVPPQKPKKKKKKSRRRTKVEPSNSDGRPAQAGLMRKLEQAEAWGMQACCLTKLRKVTVWDSHSLPLLRWPWTPKLSSFHFSVSGLRWEIDNHALVMSRMKELQELSMFVEPFTKTPPSPQPVVPPPADEPHTDENVDRCNQTDKKGESHRTRKQAARASTAASVIKPAQAETSDCASSRAHSYLYEPAMAPRYEGDVRKCRGKPKRMYGDACSWCELGGPCLRAVSGLTTLTSLTLGIYGDADCCVFDFMALSRLTQLQDLRLTIYKGSTKLNTAAWLKEGGNLKVPCLHKLRRLQIDAPVPTSDADPYFQSVTQLPLLQSLTMRLYWTREAMEKMLKQITEFRGASPARFTELMIGDQRWNKSGMTAVNTSQQTHHQSVFKALNPYLLQFTGLKRLQLPGGELYDILDLLSEPIREDPNGEGPFKHLEDLFSLYIPDQDVEDVEENDRRRRVQLQNQGNQSDPHRLHYDYLASVHLPCHLTRLAISLGSYAPPQVGTALGHLRRLRHLSLCFRGTGYNSAENMTPYLRAIGSLTRLSTICFMGAQVITGSEYRNVSLLLSAEEPDMDTDVLRALGQSLHELAPYGHLQQLYLWGLFLCGRDGGFYDALARLRSLRVLSFLGCSTSPQGVLSMTRTFRWSQGLTIRKFHLFTLNPVLYRLIDLPAFLRAITNSGISQATFCVSKSRRDAWITKKSFAEYSHLYEDVAEKRVMQHLIRDIKTNFEEIGVHAANAGRGMKMTDYALPAHIPNWNPVQDQSMLDDVSTSVEDIIRAVCPDHAAEAMNYIFSDDS